jgi:YVTN family beta-propeller protein
MRSVSEINTTTDQRARADAIVREGGYVNGHKPTDQTSSPEISTAVSFSIVTEIRTGHGAISGLAAGAEGTWLLAAHYGDNSVSWIDTATFAVAGTVPGVNEPFAIAIAGAHSARAYVSTVSPAYDSIAAIEAGSDRVVAVHPVAHSVSDLVVSPDGRHVYAGRTAVDGADVAVLDTSTGQVDATGIAAAPGTAAQCVRVSQDGRRLYLATDGPSGAKLVVVDAHRKRVVDTVEIGTPIRDVALHPDGGTAYVASCGPSFEGLLDVVDTATNTVTNTNKVAEISGFLTQMTVSRDGERAYLVADDTVTVLCTLTHDVIGVIAMGRRPSCAIERPDGKLLYVADYTGTVTVISMACRQTDEWAQLRQLEPATT